MKATPRLVYLPRWPDGWCGYRVVGAAAREGEGMADDIRSVLTSSAEVYARRERASARKCREALAGMRDQTTRYARTIEALAVLHEQVAALWADALSRGLPDGPIPPGWPREGEDGGRG